MPAGTYTRRILEQLLVDLSWASSRMEGNTHDVLQTEHLIRFGEESEGMNREEALMKLNPRDAIQYVVENLEEISLRRHDLLSVHALLSDGLLADPAISRRFAQSRSEIRIRAIDRVNKRTSRVVSNISLLKSGLAPMSFTTMDDRACFDGLIGVYELNNVSLFRVFCIDAYLASAGRYRAFPAEAESPEKAAPAFQEFVRAAVHRCVF